MISIIFFVSIILYQRLSQHVMESKLHQNLSENENAVVIDDILVQGKGQMRALYLRDVIEELIKVPMTKEDATSQRKLDAVLTTFLRKNFELKSVWLLRGSKRKL